MEFKKLVVLLVVLIASFPVKAMKISGTIKLQDDWQPVVFLASLNSLENLFVASPDFVIAESFIQPDGSFSIQTTSVPSDARFYRLYLTKGNGSSVEFNTSTHRNYVHLLLDKKSHIEIDAKVEDNTLVLNNLSGAVENNVIQYLDNELAERKLQFAGDLTKAKRDFLQLDLEMFIRNFADTVPNTLLGLYALWHIEEKNTDFIQNSKFYFDFEKRINKQFPLTFYSEAYSTLLNDLIGFRDMVCEIPEVRAKWKDKVLILLSALVLVLFVLVFYYKQKLIQLTTENSFSKHSFLSLTDKEKEILKLLAEGKTNKEIALELYVELSTVKTHINSIYKQLKLSNRKEAIEYYRSVK